MPSRLCCLLSLSQSSLFPPMHGQISDEYVRLDPTVYTLCKPYQSRVCGSWFWILHLMVSGLFPIAMGLWFHWLVSQTNRKWFGRRTNVDRKQGHTHGSPVSLCVAPLEVLHWRIFSLALMKQNFTYTEWLWWAFSMRNTFPLDDIKAWGSL